jgi:predicted Abi (CAAX) family protease
MKQGLHWLRSHRYIRWVLWGCFSLSCVILTAIAAPTFEAQYTITQRADFNQISHYPPQQTPPRDRYRPVGAWVGRLILPPPEQRTDQSDWVWLEVYHAPDRDLIGQRLRLEWSPDPAVQQYVAAVTRDVKFSAAIATSQKKGNLHPDRLNGRSRVGPLQSLAGAHPVDDVTVTLDTANILRQAGTSPRVQIETDPVLTTGRFYGLVKILAVAPTQNPAFIPPDCPGPAPCPSELFQVQHYQAATGQFDGAVETIRVPQQPRDGIGVFVSTPRDLDKSPVGKSGWYIYGAPDKSGLFTVQALKPRALVQLRPQEILRDEAKGLDYINYENWHDTEKLEGTLQTVLVDPTDLPMTAPVDPSAARPMDRPASTNAPGNPDAGAIATPQADWQSQWSEGQRALVMHLFGGRGGKSGEAPAFGTVTGHFSYGVATVQRQPLTQQLEWNIRYQQVYATNVEGFISGTNDWTAYMGDLRRGWLYTRPVADVLVKLDIIEDYDFGSDRISPLQEFSRQLQVINARYRSGDGSGAAVVTPATSCVQDSNQALFATVQQVRHRVANSPAIQSWLAAHPQDPTTARFQRLIKLGDEVEKQLMPLGIVREDWKSNSDALSGTEIRDRTFRRTNAEGTENLLAALTSWRTILPRQTQDELSILFLRHGAKLWFLRTNQVGGHNPDIFPIAPTKAFGRWAIPGTPISIIAVILTRILGAINLPAFTDWLIAIAALLIYGAIALPLGFSQGFLYRQVWKASRRDYFRMGLKLLFVPALVEEFVFRVLLLPYPQAATWLMWSLWAIFGLILFVIYHPVNAKTFYKPGDPTFCDRRFLSLAALLGVTCTITYGLTGSLLLIVLIHWLVVLVWLLGLGGMERLHPPPGVALADG